MKVNEVITAGKTYGANNKILSPSEIQIKALDDKSKTLKNDAKKMRAQQQLKKAQDRMTKVNSQTTSINNSLP